MECEKRVMFTRPYRQKYFLIEVNRPFPKHYDVYISKKFGYRAVFIKPRAFLLGTFSARNDSVIVPGYEYRGLILEHIIYYEIVCHGKTPIGKNMIIILSSKKLIDKIVDLKKDNFIKLRTKKTAEVEKIIEKGFIP